MTLQKYAIIDGEDVINVVEYESNPGNPPPGFSNNIIAVQSNKAGPGWKYQNGEFIPPPTPPIPPAQLIALCRLNAMARLQSTDWVEIPSVSNTSLTPHLTNIGEFITYRSAVRMYAVNPVENPVWPDKPIEQWSI